VPEVIERRALAIALVLGMAAPTSADVRPEDAAQASDLFKQGQAIIDTDPKDPAQIEAACAKFEASLALDEQIGTKLNLANCRERQDRSLDAYELYAAAAEEAKRTKKEGREQFARGRIAALAPKLGHVTLRVVQPQPVDLAIRIGTTALPAAEWAIEHAVAPGAIELDATASNHAPFHIQRQVAAGEQIVIDVPALAANAATPGGGGPVVDTGPRRSRLPIIIGASGGVLMLASLGLGLHAKSRYDDAKSANDMDGVSSAQREADIATGVVIVGAVAFTVGAVLYFRGRKADRDRVVVAPTAVGGRGGIAVSGSF
jgi:hypothetical protein